MYVNPFGEPSPAPRGREPVRTQPHSIPRSNPKTGGSNVRDVGTSQSSKSKPEWTPWGLFEAVWKSPGKGMLDEVGGALAGEAIRRARTPADTAAFYRILADLPTVGSMTQRDFARFQIRTVKHLPHALALKIQTHAHGIRAGRFSPRSLPKGMERHRRPMRQDTWHQKASEEVNKFAQAKFSYGDQYKSNPFVKAGEFVGGTIPYVAAFLSGPVIGLLGGAALGTSQARNRAFQEASRKGATKQQAFDAGRLGAPFGAVEAVPAGRIAGKASKLTGPLLQSWTKNALKDASAEGVQEGISQVIDNTIAWQVYDPNRDLFSGAGDAALYGASAGLLLSGLSQGGQTAADHLFIRRRRRSVEPPTQNTAVATNSKQVDASPEDGARRMSAAESVSSSDQIVDGETGLAAPNLRTNIEQNPDFRQQEDAVRRLLALNNEPDTVPQAVTAIPGGRKSFSGFRGETPPVKAQRIGILSGRNEAEVPNSQSSGLSLAATPDAQAEASIEFLRQTIGGTAPQQKIASSELSTQPTGLPIPGLRNNNISDRLWGIADVGNVDFFELSRRARALQIAAGQQGDADHAKLLGQIKVAQEQALRSNETGAASAVGAVPDVTRSGEMGVHQWPNEQGTALLGDRIPTEVETASVETQTPPSVAMNAMHSVPAQVASTEGGSSPIELGVPPHKKILAAPPTNRIVNRFFERPGYPADILFDSNGVVAIRDRDGKFKLITDFEQRDHFLRGRFGETMTDWMWRLAGATKLNNNGEWMTMRSKPNTRGYDLAVLLPKISVFDEYKYGVIDAKMNRNLPGKSKNTKKPQLDENWIKGNFSKSKIKNVSRKELISSYIALISRVDNYGNIRLFNTDGTPFEWNYNNVKR